ncbi:DUF4011 domain-containing anti-phage protein Hhe [Thalassotalea maritima]|uniref:DUF4011 domain-containing anti-phage protein Hhe n=1 Tax=Thalassotalea maritima TaxID=3242416 RepID=UPI003526F484
MSNAANNNDQGDFAFASLQSIRNRLLDLTGRNRLLNFRHGRGGYVRLIDASPDQLATQLLDGDAFTFTAIAEPSREELIRDDYIDIDSDGQELILKPSPSAKEWADINGINSNFDLLDTSLNQATLAGQKPPSKHGDTTIQSLLFANALEGQLRRIRSKANAAIEETGANILYLAFGFLQWFEDDTHSKAKLAPLYLIPVKITKASLNKTLGVYNYTIEYTGEELMTNLSLREKLKIDFHLQLPELNDDMLPEQYWQIIEQKLLPHKSTWQLKGYCTLGMFDFSKLLMYLDLAPERWPQGDSGIQNHPIIQSFFGKQHASHEQSSQASTHGFSSEHLLDEIDNIHQQYPLIYDADSSQHSALIDALQGKNLVIEGPPGTGKSQSITNLIAAAMARGKKVLFVAEKMAALQVVKKRLSKAGLGDFCLELHSHKTHKKQVYENIAQRLQQQSNYQYPDTIDLHITLYEQQKRQLNRYASLINSPWQQTGKTIQQILMAATKYRLQFPDIDIATLKANNIISTNITAISMQQASDALRRYIDVHKEISQQLGKQASLTEHPWYGVTNSQLQLLDSDGVCSLLADWTSATHQLLTTVQRLHQHINAQSEKGDTALTISLSSIDILIADADLLTSIRQGLTDKVDTSALTRLTTQHADTLHAHIDTYQQHQTECNALLRVFNAGVFADDSTRQQLKHAVDELAQHLNSSLTLSDCASSIENLAALPTLTQQLINDFSTLAQHAPELSTYQASNIGDLHTLHHYIRLISELDNTLLSRRHSLFDNDQLDNDLPILKQHLENLVQLRQQLAPLFKLDALPPATELDQLNRTISDAGFFRWFSSKWRQAKATLLSLATNDKPYKELASALASLQRYQTELEALNNTHRYSELLQHEYQGINTRIDDIITIRAWYKRVRSAFGIGFGHDVALASSLFGLDTDIAKGIKYLAEQSTMSTMNKLISTWQEVMTSFDRTITSQIENDLTDNHVTLTCQTLSNHLSLVLSLLNTSSSHIDQTSLDHSLSEISSLSKRVANLHTTQQSFIAQNIVAQMFNESLKLTLRDDCSEQLTIITSTLSLYRQITTLQNQALRHYVLHHISEPTLQTLIDVNKDIEQAYRQYRQQQQSFVDEVKLDIQAWQQHHVDLPSLLQRNQRALLQPRWLGPWLDFLRLKESLHAHGLDRLLKACDQGDITLAHLVPLYLYSIYDTLAHDIMLNTPELAQFSGAEHNAIIKQFCDIDDRLKPLQQQKVAYQIAENGIRATHTGIATGKVANYSEMGLINHEINKKTRHVPIRQLLKRAGKSLLALKPCFMMGPHSVAKYLRPGDIEFDIIVMDEASQIKPEDALGTIARGKQVVVVGDPKQLPPTSFFDRAIDNDDDELTAIELSESILDVSLPMFYARRLRWHYRSRHESLIAFSNQQFYDDNLVVFPSPASNSDEFGVKFTYIKNGRFVKQKNIEEAKVIAHAVRNHLLHHANESLGVVAMSVKQQEQIDNAIEALAKSDEQFANALVTNEQSEEPLFVKNLENVQGDERDVIYISFTYGPAEVGASTMAQRFGPINSSTGGRRLNVLFTRSKKRMHAFSSMTANHVVVKDSSSQGVRALQQFLQFAQSGQLATKAINTSDSTSDFTSALSTTLKGNGFNCTANVGVAGYFINVAVQASNQPGHYLMGVETDGKAYYDAKSARDRDRLLPAAPRRLGWHLTRIWSPDWYKNPQAQINPIVETLTALDNELKKQTEVTGNIEETTEIEQALQREQQQAEEIKDISDSKQTLNEKLIAFEQYLITTHSDPVPKANRLLRPAMIAALCQFKPTSESDYVELIPDFLRSATAKAHQQYLPQVLAIIAEDEHDSS